MAVYCYDTLKELAAQRGESVKDLCALSVNNDPFYVGQPAQRQAAEWFMSLWPKYGSARRYLRGMHYQIVTQGEPVKLPITLTWTDKDSGEKQATDVYLNVERCWEYLETASKYARYLGLLGADELRDRRNREPYVFTVGYSEDVTEPSIGVSGEKEPYLGAYTMPLLPTLPALPWALPHLPSLGVDDDYSVAQPYHIEVWIEKAAMDEELLPLCQQYGVNLIVGAGELSVPAVRKLLARSLESRKPVRILYISDFDPAGLGMPISVARKIEFYLRNEAELCDVSAALQPIVLTADQVAEYHLPRIPVKDGDRRKANFEAAYGEGQVELDALVSLRPGVFERIVEAAILRYYDTGLDDRLRDADSELRDALNGTTWIIRQRHSGAWAAIEEDYNALRQDFETTRQEFAALVAPFQPQIDAYKDRLAALKDRMGEAYGMVYADLDQAADDFATWEYPAPTPDVIGDYASMLYHSDRDYFTQLAAYKARRHGRNGHSGGEDA